MEPRIVPAGLVPLFFDSVASRCITVHRSDKSQKAAIRAVPQPMTPHFDGVAWFDVLAFDSFRFESPGIGGFKKPHGRLTLVILFTSRYSQE